MTFRTCRNSSFMFPDESQSGYNCASNLRVQLIAPRQNPILVKAHSI